MSPTDRLEPGCWPVDTGPIQLGKYSVVAYHRPFGGGSGSGDRLLLRAIPRDKLVFLVADATGHGAGGDVIWRRCDEQFTTLWSELLEVPDLGGVEVFARDFNDMLYNVESTPEMPLSQIALTVGVISTAGYLELATFGYGVHALVATRSGLWWTETERLFGLKLGWLPTEAWDTTPRAFVGHSIQDVHRIMLLTDGFLGDDFADMDATLADVRTLGQTCAEETDISAATTSVLKRTHDGDDATLVAIDIGGAGAQP